MLAVGRTRSVLALALGISGEPSLLEARELVTRDVTVRGLLSGSSAFVETIEELAGESGRRLERLIGTVVPLERAVDLFESETAGPKRQVSV